MTVIIDDTTLNVRINTKGKLPRLPFVDIKNLVLGKNYDLSIAFVGKTISQKLNREYRGKNKPTNILSFANSTTSGELILHLDTIKKDAPLFSLNLKDFTIFLIIHGCLHLKGMDHGAIMERAEKKYFKKITGVTLW